jgi:hypothetical protein
MGVTGASLLAIAGTDPVSGGGFEAGEELSVGSGGAAWRLQDSATTARVNSNKQLTTAILTGAT